MNDLREAINEHIYDLENSMMNKLHFGRWYDGIKLDGFDHLCWMIRENMYEHQGSFPDLGIKGYHRYNFVVRMFLAWLFRLKCPYCDEDGMSGYYEREACNECDGYHLRWNDLIRNKIKNFCQSKGTEERQYYEFHKYYSLTVERGTK